MRHTKPPTRRGVLLLVILALLAMFGMVAVTFVVVASQARLAAEAHQRLDEVTEPPEKLLNSALMQVLRGSNNRASALGPHSLLEDVYGNNATAPQSAGSAVAHTSGQMIEFATPSLSILEARRRVGGVLTIVPPAAAGASRIVGRSTRIVQALDDGAGGNVRLLLLPFDGLAVNDAVSQISAGCTFFISGAPFSGTGFGWDGAQMTDMALRPGNPANRAAGVQANEDYDAPDFQNMLLAAKSINIHGNVQQVIPSLHRPALVRYWQNRGGAPLTDYVLRPITSNHPNFTGGNPNYGLAPFGFNAIDGPWDVDNDGDGIPDSVWVDLGLPARSSPDGRMVKPLFAILVVDLDGRLNVNAHGSLAQVNSDPWGRIGNYYAMPTSSTSQRFATGTIEVRGQGYGPAEINLAPLFFPAATLGYSAGYQQLLRGGGGLRGRYGVNTVPGVSGIDLLCERRWFDYDYANGYAAGAADAYGTPPDMQGGIAVGLDLAGRPIWDPNFCGQAGMNNPYELNPMRRVSRGRQDDALPDIPFSTTELERVLRGYDRDAVTLPPRLRQLLQLGGVDSRYRRHELTTDSIDVPVPSAAGRVSAAAPSFVDLLIARGVPQQHWNALFDPELLVGRKMNLNRPLPPGDVQARQLLARHLFCLAMLLREPGYRSPWPNADAGVPGNEIYLTVRRIAQWAVNVVDFIDNDAIMTPFQYVEDPFSNGWTAPVGIPAQKTYNPRYVVWGVERPSLLLTETLAFHDRRVADTKAAGPEDGRRQDKKEGSDPPAPDDEDLDQPRMPQGSLFVELYCASEPGAKKSTDLYTPDGLLDLNKLGGTGFIRSPVWRMAITKEARSDPETNPNNVAARLNNPAHSHYAPLTFSIETDYGASLVPGSAPEIEIERFVSFATAAENLVYSGFNLPVYEIRTPRVYLAPGEYVVVGPREWTAVGSTNESPPRPSPQGIRLAPSPVSVTANTLGGRSYPSQIRTPKSMVAAGGDRAVGISVSEPVADPMSGYYPPGTHAGPDGVKDWYGDPTNGPFLDKPLDSQPGKPLADDGLLETGTYQGYKYVLLQRLANPTQPYNAITNPYRTVDWMPIDLTVFNGQDRRPEPWPPEWSVDEDGEPIDFAWDPDDPNIDSANDRLRFQTRQRAGASHNLWAQVFSTPENTSPASSTPTPAPFFTHPLGHSMGFLNPAFGNDSDPPGLTEAGHLGDPTRPFPWITWNNRPLVNPYELMMVPATTAARLGWEYTLAPNGGAEAPYTAGPDDDDQHLYDHEEVGFVHLMNFFHSGGTSSELHRIFDYLAVPSRFAGAHAHVPAMSPPNHLVPTYREPGKVNLNTIYSERVFRGLMNGFRENDADLWDKFVRSRRGYAGGNAASYPTEFAQPFRSAAGFRLRPPGLPQPDPNREIEATLLRSDPDDRETPLFALDSASDVNQTDRNPYFRYQGLMRLANLTTTRSNVYAVWITVGFFEVSPTGPDPNAHPDGLQFGRELGTDTGEIRRHRAFYIIDRSIPVGFRRGEDLNVEKTVLLRRFIE